MKLYPLLLLVGTLQGQMKVPDNCHDYGDNLVCNALPVGNTNGTTFSGQMPQCSINGGKPFPARPSGCYAEDANKPVAGSADGTPKPVAPVEAQIKTVCDAASAKIAAIQKAHPEIQIQVSCGVYETIFDSETAQKKTYPLTVKEIDELDYRRAVSTVAFHNEDALVKRIIAAHGVRVPEYNDPCWHFVGIILGDHFITENFPAPQYAAKHGCYAGSKP